MVHGTEQANLGLGIGAVRAAQPFNDADNTFENIELVEGGTVPIGSIGNAELAADAVTSAKILDGTIAQLDLAVAQRKREKRSVWFDLDNGAGTTIDDVILKASVALTVLAARIIYVDATSGIVAAGNAKIGTTLGGAEIVAATAYENTKAVGTSTAMAIVAGAVAANGAVFVRHTGVAAVAAGQAVVELEYVFD